MPTRDQILQFDGGKPSNLDPWVVKPLRAHIEIADYDKSWPSEAQSISDRLRDILGPKALRIDHVGSTSVPGLAAKPIIDVDVTMANPANEPAWLPALQEAGFVLTVREPWLQEHRMLRGGRRPDDRVAPTDGGPASNIHVYGLTSPQPIRHLIFRNWLRANELDRDRYEAAKREAAAASVAQAAFVMDYNALKQITMREIYGRAFRAVGLTE